MSKTIFTIPTTKLIEWILYWAVVGLGTLILFFLITSTWIGHSVREKCDYAKARYGQTDCVDALIQAFEDDSNNRLDQRNQTAWALGQMGDKRALPVLRKYYDGGECDHKHKLCQYELNKAIKLIENDFNATAFLWRYKIK